MLVNASRITVFSGCAQEFFNCTERNGRWWLIAEPSIECYDLSSWNQHTKLLPVCCAAVLVYVIGIPMLFATLLFRNRKVGGSAAPFREDCRAAPLPRKTLPSAA